MNKKIASIIGIVLGVAIIIVGFCVQGVSVDVSSSSIGRYITFGADFYTEMYAVTQEVGEAVNSANKNIHGAVNIAQRNICGAVESVCGAIGWLIVAIGLFDIAYFVCKMASCGENYSGNNYNAAPTTASTYTTQSQATPTSYSAPSIIKPKESASVDEWKCTCGRIHKNYEASCVCGVTKFEAKMKNSQNN